MRTVLILMTASYPFGRGEPFLAHEIPHLDEAFDEIVVLSNDTESERRRPLPPSTRCHRHSYELSRWEKPLSVFGLLHPAVWRELARVCGPYPATLTRTVLATILVSWWKGLKFARIIRELARGYPGARVHAYSYWANDMAVAAALARRRGWVESAVCRAHGWDVYFHRAEGNFLPFRHFLASELDHYLFVSEHGRRYFESLVGSGRYPSPGCARLGTPEASGEPLGSRHPFTVVSCSKMIPLKRVELIARALRHVSAPVRWIHVGDGPGRNAVEAVCRDLPDRIDVDLRGFVPNPEVLALYRSVRPSLFVNVSSSEGLPVSMMEAMSTGIPVIGTDVGGVSEIVVHEANGLLLPSDPTPREVAGAIEAVAELSAREYRKYTEEAWATWHDRFRADDNYRAFVRRILTPGGSRRRDGCARDE